MDPGYTTLDPKTLPRADLLLRQEPVRPKPTVVAIRSLPALAGLIPAWEELAAAALEPNVFYEHWMLLPALEACGAGRDIRIVLVLLPAAHNPNGQAKLLGLFPLERISRPKRLNVPAVGLWRYAHGYLCTPLIRADAAAQCMSAFFEWLRSEEANASLAELRWFSGDGPFHKLLVDLSNDFALAKGTTDIFTRGLWRKGDDSAGDPESAISGQLRRCLRRKERRLNEEGRLQHVALRPGDDIGRWIDEFLQLEAGGWKGQRGSALACTPAGRPYFSTIAAAAFQRGRLLMLGLDFDGRPIARRCAFVAGKGSFAFKTAYDESFAHFSPGAMLEVDSIRQLCGLPGVEWMDSCAAPDNLLVNRLANDRRTIQSLAIGMGVLGELVVSSLPLLRWANRRFRRRSAAADPRDSPKGRSLAEAPMN